MKASRPMRHRQRGNAIIEVIVALLALSPFLVGIPLLGKQLDIKHKTYDAARYSVWERTVWRSAGASNHKAEEDISLEIRDRTLGDPRSGVISAASVRAQGIGENALWRDRRHGRLLDYDNTPVPTRLAHEERNSPVEVGYWFVPGVAHGEGPIGTLAEILRVRHLNLDRRTFANASVSIDLRPILSQTAQQTPSFGRQTETLQQENRLAQQATAAILSDSWSARDENTMRRRVDDVTTRELIEELEAPGRIIGLQARGKGEPLYGEGQYGWDPDLRPHSTTLPSAYVFRR